MMSKLRAFIDHVKSRSDTGDRKRIRSGKAQQGERERKPAGAGSGRLRRR
jgi:hypothetical protein